jgi:hypothetical protein
MILGFSTQLKGKPTYFVDKILIGIDKHLGVFHTENFRKYYKKKFDSKPPININSKIHTIREDPKDRWKKGNKIDFFINVRKKDMFRFAPVLVVVSTQKFEIKYHTNTFLVYIDEKLFFFGNRDFTINEFENYEGMLKLAHNDGFETIQDFCTYFNEDFTGKIIHWTDLRY